MRLGCLMDKFLIQELFADVRNHYICHAHALGIGGRNLITQGAWDFWQRQGVRAICLHWNLEPI